MPDPLKTFLEGAVAPPLPQDGQLPFYLQQRLALDGIQPPSWLWVNEDDFLVLNVRNSLAGVNLQVAARLMDVNGRITTPSFTVGPANDRSIVSTSQKLYQGYLLGATVTAIGGTLPNRGQTYCVLKLQRMPAPSNLSHLILGADYISGTTGLEWPYGRIIASVEGPGLVVSSSVANPAAGADWSITVSGLARWRFRGMSAQLVTSAAVATRQVAIIIDDGVNTFFTVEAASTQLAGITQIYNLIPGNTLTTLISTQQPVYIPLDLYLAAGWRVRSSTTSIQAADQWSAIRFISEQWIED